MPSRGSTGGGTGTNTTQPVDTTGATVIAVLCYWYTPGTTPTLTDSAGNTWTFAGPAVTFGRSAGASYAGIGTTVTGATSCVSDPMKTPSPITVGCLFTPS